MQLHSSYLLKTNQVDRSTPIDESAFIVERLDGDIGLVIFETNWLSVFYPGGQLDGGDYLQIL